MLRYSDITLQPLKSHKFTVRRSFRFRDIEVPQGFVTDGASVPRLFWSLFPPNRTDYLPCAIVHDYLCEKRDFKRADKCFGECLEELGVNRFARVVMYLSVRVYHRFRYQQ